MRDIEEHRKFDWTNHHKQLTVDDRHSILSGNIEDIIAI